MRQALQLIRCTAKLQRKLGIKPKALGTYEPDRVLLAGEQTGGLVYGSTRLDASDV
jgi:hypothetical protein